VVKFQIRYTSLAVHTLGQFKPKKMNDFDSKYNNKMRDLHKLPDQLYVLYRLKGLERNLHEL